MTQTLLSVSPQIVSIQSLITPEEANKILSSNLPFQKSKGYTFDKAHAGGTESDYRTSSTYIDTADTLGWVVSRSMPFLKLQFPELTLGHIENVQLQKYNKSEYYKPHYDFFNIPGHEDHVTNDRIATLIVYLNDEFTGGTTKFTSLNLDVTPVAGNALFFRYDYDLETNIKTMHSGEPVSAGCKVIATIWIRKSRWRSLPD
jgi:prolyl 4-hydroxylase